MEKIIWVFLIHTLAVRRGSGKSGSVGRGGTAGGMRERGWGWADVSSAAFTAPPRLLRDDDGL